MKEGLPKGKSKIRNGRKSLWKFIWFRICKKLSYSDLHYLLRSECNLHYLLKSESNGFEIHNPNLTDLDFAFSALTLLVGQQEEHPACKKWGDGGGGHWLVRMEWRPAGWSMCLPLLIFPCTMKSRGSFLAPADPGGSGKRTINGCGGGGIGFRQHLNSNSNTSLTFMGCLWNGWS